MNKPAQARPSDYATTPDQAATTIAPWKWFVVAAAAGLALCASKLNLDLWYDEIYTLRHFVSKPVFSIVTDYSAPNNHVFYSLLLRPWYLLSTNEYLLRFPGLLFATGTLACVFHIGWRWQGIFTAVLATLTLGLNIMFLAHAMQLRGYGLSMFLVALLADLMLGPVDATARTTWRGLFGTVALATALIYTVPTNALFVVPLALFDLIRAWRRGSQAWRTRLLVWFAAATATFVCYLPILNAVLTTGGGGAGNGPSAGMELGREYSSVALRDLIWLSPVLVLAALGSAFGAWQGPKGRSVLAGLLVLMHLLPFLICTALGMRPFARNFCPLLPFTALAVGYLLAHALEWSQRRGYLPQCNERLVTMAGLALGLVLGPAVYLYPARLATVCARTFAQDGYYNYYAANYHPSRVAEFLSTRVATDEPYQILAAQLDHFNIDHALLQHSVSGSNLPPSIPSKTPRVIYCIVPPIVDWQDLSQQSGLSVERLQKFARVADFGYYRVLQGNGP